MPSSGTSAPPSTVASSCKPGTQEVLPAGWSQAPEDGLLRGNEELLNSNTWNQTAKDQNDFNEELMRKGPRDEDGFRVVALDAGALRAKDYVVMNLSRQVVAGVAGGGKFKLHPNRHAVVHPKPDRGENLCFASLHYRRDDQWRSFFSSNWRLREQCRTLIFLHDPRSANPPPQSSHASGHLRSAPVVVQFLPFSLA